jgi:hypothetical protein
MAKAKTQGTILRVSTAAGSPKTITGVTAANPPVVTSATHGLTAGTIIVISMPTGMIELDGRAFVVSNPLTNTFELKGVDGTTYTTYASGGTATPQTMLEVGQVKSIDGFDGEAPDIDISDLRSTAVENFVGLQDFGGLRMDIWHDYTSTAHAKMRSLKALGTVGYFAITQTDGAISAMAALVKSFTWKADQNSAYGGSAALKFRNEPAWFA